jgi:tol-pal system protein YbgF
LCKNVNEYAQMMAYRLCLFALFMTAIFSGSAFAQWTSAPSQPVEGWGSTPSRPPPQEGWGSAPIGPSGPPGAESDPSLRLGRLEEQLRALNGQIEQLQFQNKTLQEQLQKMQEDAEFRFQQLEGGKKGGSSSRPSPRAQITSPTPERRLTEAGQPPQLGAPPRNLGQLPADAAGNPMNSAPGAVEQPLEPLPEMPPDAGGPSKTKSANVTARSGSPEDQYDLAYGYMLRGDYEKAEDAFKDYLSDNPKHANASKAQYWLGEAQYQRRQYKAAAESFLKVYNEHPDSEKAPESLLRLGMSLKALGQKEAACATFAEVSNKYPKSSQAVKKRVQTEQRSTSC